MNPMFYFLLALTTVLAATTVMAGPVLDTDGDFIFHGSYYVLPVIRGRGGGLALSGRDGKPCPLDIVQKSSELDKGIPVKFSNWMSRVGFVPESQNLNIQTDVAATICVQSTYWWVDEFDKETKKWFIKAGPKPVGFGKDSLKSFFKIEKSGDSGDYKFVICPNKDKCVDVGIFVDENRVRRLALSSTPFLVKFKKANVTEELSKTMMSM